MRAFRTLGLLAGIAVVALLPLYGDVRPSDAVSHAEWARLALRGLGLLSEAPGVNDTAAQAFATLSGRDSRSFPAEQYVRGARVETEGEGGARRIRATGGIGEVVYAMGVARGGDYRLRFHVSGPAAAEAEMTKAGDDAVFRRFNVPAAPVMGWIDAGTVHLDPGAYDATVLLPEGGTLEHIEIAPPCQEPIEPPGGWKAAGITTSEDVAVTVLQALDLEAELPPAGLPVEYHASDLQLEDGARVLRAATSTGAFRSGPRGSRVTLVAELPEDGLYTLSAFGVPTGGQRWLVDGCRTSLVCPSNDPLPRWRTILSGRFQKGRHLFSASLGPDTVVERLRLEPKKATAADYAGAVGRLGLELSPGGPVTRDRAEEARRFLERRRAQENAELCGDILQPGTLVAELATGGPGGVAGGEVGPGGGTSDPGTGGGGGGTVPPPIIPSLPPGSPVLPNQFAGSK